MNREEDVRACNNELKTMSARFQQEHIQITRFLSKIDDVAILKASLKQSKLHERELQDEIASLELEQSDRSTSPSDGSEFEGDVQVASKVADVHCQTYFPKSRITTEDLASLGQGRTPSPAIRYLILCFLTAGMEQSMATKATILLLNTSRLQTL